MTETDELAPAWQACLADAGLTSLRQLLDAAPPAGLGGRWEALTKPGLGGRERWRWELPGTDAPVLYLKRYRRTPLREQLDRLHRQCVRHSRGWWEYHQATELAQRYIPAVLAVGVAERMRGPLEVCSAVLFAAVPGDALDRVWPRLCAQRALLTQGAARHELVRALARFVSAFHQTGACHRDLYLCHIFAELDADARRPPSFTLIDLARTHRPRVRRLRWLLKDLSQLDCSARQVGATRTDRLRFLVAYLGLEKDAPRVAYYGRRIVRKSDRILRRIARQSQGQ